MIVVIAPCTIHAIPIRVFGPLASRIARTVGTVILVGVAPGAVCCALKGRCVLTWHLDGLGLDHAAAVCWRRHDLRRRCVHLGTGCVDRRGRARRCVGRAIMPSCCHRMRERVTITSIIKELLRRGPLAIVARRRSLLSEIRRGSRRTVDAMTAARIRVDHETAMRGAEVALWAEYLRIV